MNDDVDMTRYIVFEEIRPVAVVSKHEIPLSESEAALEERTRRVSNTLRGYYGRQ